VFIPCKGTTTEIRSYTFIDEIVLPGECSKIVKVKVTQPMNTI